MEVGGTSVLSQDGNGDRDADLEKLNVGELFVRAFRWLLLFMLAIVLEKSIEGVAFRVGATPEFPSSGLLIGPDFVSGLEAFGRSLKPNYAYIGAFIEVLVLLLFAVRYALCLVDPVERAAGLAIEYVPAEAEQAEAAEAEQEGSAEAEQEEAAEAEQEEAAKAGQEGSAEAEKVGSLEAEQEEASKAEQRETERLSRRALLSALSKVDGRHAALILLIAIPEFGLLIHAGLALPSTNQWLVLLGWLVVWDTLAFFVFVPFAAYSWMFVLTLRHLGNGAASWTSFFGQFFKTILRALKLLTQVAASTIMIAIGNSSATPQRELFKRFQKRSREVVDLLFTATEDLIVKRQDLNVKRQKSKKAWEDGLDDLTKLLSAFPAYLQWNLLDLVIVLGGLCVYRAASSPLRDGFAEVLVPFFILLATALAAYRNYRTQPYLWKRHVVLLSRVGGSSYG